jgi:hypothetical protein
MRVHAVQPSGSIFAAVSPHACIVQNARKFLELLCQNSESDDMSDLATGYNML